MNRRKAGKRHPSAVCSARVSPGGDRQTCAVLRTTRRRGATAVEFALVAIPLFVIVFASIEFCRAFLVANSLEEAARTGCRVAILSGATSEDVEEQVDSILSASGIEGHTTAIRPPHLNNAKPFEQVTVSISASFSDLTWIPTPSYLNRYRIVSQCTMPREGVTDSSP